MGLLRFIIYGNILISISAGLLSFGLTTFLECETPQYYFYCVFFATLFIYNFQRVPRLNEVSDKYSDRHIWLSDNKNTLYALILVGLLGALTSYFGFLFVQNDFLFLFLISLGGMLYALKVFAGKALRDFPFIKIHLISLTWVLIIIVWPLVREEKSILDHWELLTGLYCVMLAITIPFDIRDLSFDDPHKKTTPQLIGTKSSKVVAATLLLLGYLLLVINSQIFLRNPFYYISFIGFFILIIKTNKERKEMYFSGLIDGWIIVLGMLFLFTHT
jgi:1,4-dihydroxy-2-naphthoate octaprenyltransferase